MIALRKLRAHRSVAVGAAIALLASGAVSAQGLPKTFAWSAYPTGSSGYAASVAVGNALADDGYKLRVLPAKNDISRMTPLKTKQVQFSSMGVGSYQSQEGVEDFGKKAWGPQPIRLVLMGWGDANNAVVATAKEANIKTAADMRGKRLAWVVGGPALNQNLEAWLAYGGLTWDDVIKVTVPGWGQSLDGLINGTIDAAIASTNTSKLFEVASSPRGLAFFPAPPEEKENWARMSKVAPWFVPHVATAGVGLSKEHPLVGATFGYPVLISYDWQSDEAVYDMVKLLHTHYDKYKDAHAAAAGFAMNLQVFQWIIPYHAGAVRYFKEIGVWKPEDEAHNNRLLERQKVLQEAWKKSGTKDDENLSDWMAARASALEAAGFDPIWRN